MVVPDRRDLVVPGHLMDTESTEVGKEGYRQSRMERCTEWRAARARAMKTAHGGHQENRGERDQANEEDGRVQHGCRWKGKTSVEDSDVAVSSGERDQASGGRVRSGCRCKRETAIKELKAMM